MLKLKILSKEEMEAREKEKKEREKEALIREKERADLSEITDDMTVLEVVKKSVPYTWEEVFNSSIPEFETISELLEEDRSNGQRLPFNKNLFTIFYRVKLPDVKVVIISQDPYHTLLNDGTPQATGMAFSVPRGNPIPSSLKNIYKEISNNYPETFVGPAHGDLSYWAEQGVFLLNTCLTVRQGAPGCHKQLWMSFVKKVLSAITAVNPHVIFILWGAHAQKLKKFIGNSGYVLEGVHPSGLSANRGFFGCQHFLKVNEILTKLKRKPIDWNVK